jgi:hypothetical protein
VVTFSDAMSSRLRMMCPPERSYWDIASLERYVPPARHVPCMICSLADALPIPDTAEKFISGVIDTGEKF